MTTDFSFTPGRRVTSTKAPRGMVRRPVMTGWGKIRHKTMCGICRKHKVVGGDVRCRFCIEAQG